MRKVKVGAIQPTTYLKNHRDNLDVSLKLLEQAGEAGCDIVTTCEDIAIVSHYGTDITKYDEFVKIVRESHAIVDEELSALAANYRMYIIGARLVWRDGKVYNTAAVFDRQGKIIGEYIKTQLPPNEAWYTEPGSDLNVFHLDFGCIGINICYDMMFPETVRTLALKDAEIVFHPTFGYGWNDSMGEATLRTRANDNGVYIVTAKNYAYNGAGKSSVIDHWGQVLCDAGSYPNVIVTKTIDLDQKKLQPDWYFNTPISGTNDVRLRLERERRPELYGAICEENEKPVVLTYDEKIAILKRIEKGEVRWH
jgi:predicted amidohydrolase